MPLHRGSQFERVYQYILKVRDQIFSIYYTYHNHTWNQSCQFANIRYGLMVQHLRQIALPLSFKILIEITLFLRISYRPFGIRMQ